MSGDKHQAKEGSTESREDPGLAELHAEEIEDLKVSIQNPDSGLAELLTLWQTRDSELWATPEPFELLGRRFIKLGEPLVAYDVLRAGREVSAEDPTLRQLLALSLARSGVQDRAEVILSELISEGHENEEILGTKARVHKDLWQNSADPVEKRRQLALSYDCYSQAYLKTGGYWTGINAATMALILGRESVAADLAQQVRTQCLGALKEASIGDRYWPLATLGEAGLILRQWSEAEMWYAQAAELGKGRYGDLSSTRRNLRLLVEHLDIDGTRFENGFQIPKILVFTGHMIDHPNRSVPRFPSHLEPTVQRVIEQRLDKLGGNIGYASAACGGDILFLEALLKRHGEIHIVLPFERDSFVKESIDFLPEGNWAQRFTELAHRAAEVVVASEGRFQGGGISFEYANHMLSGLTCIRADQLETDAVLVALWDGKSGDGPGGTASMIKSWQASGKQAEIINLAEILHSVSPELAFQESGPLKASTPAPAPGAERTSIRSLLFADVVNFTELGEAEIPAFVEHFLGGVARLIKTGSYSPEARNTWGDGLYFAFRDTRAAGLFALDLQDFVRNTDWVVKGLPRALSIRIGLHVGPVHGFVDPITEKYTYFGGHVARTARIEPITPPGKVYASQAFAGFATASGVDGFKCEYVGQTPLAKGFGVFPAYHVRRT